MKRRINLYFITLMLAGLLVSSAVSLAWANNRYQRTARDTLDSALKATMQLTAGMPDDPDRFVDELAVIYGDGVRITLIDLSGQVQGETQVLLGGLENHLEREEFTEAAASGYGEAMRKSATTGQRTLYVARKWQDNYLLRFAMPVSVTRAFARSLLPVLIVDALCMSLLTALFAGRLSRRISRPYERMLTYLEAGIRGERLPEFHVEYEEMEPILVYFRELMGRITGYIGELSTKRQEIETILDNMEEGLIMLDSRMEILLINHQGSRFLDIPPDSWQKNITYLYRDEAFVRALHRAGSERRRIIADITDRTGKIYRFYINPVETGGAVMLISDVTELARLEQIRRDFAANVSHELKTPMTSISGYAELMQAGMVADSDTMRGYAGRILTESRRMTALIEDILKLSALESGPVPQAEPVELAQVFGYVREVLTEQLAANGVSMTIEGALTLQANREKLEELAFNLIDNAVKYNRPGGSVQVTMEDGGFVVADTGIGIPAEDLDRIYERFYRVDKARSRKTGGTGLGLSIARHVVELYGGKISAVSSGEGTAFTVTFPEEVVLTAQS